MDILEAQDNLLKYLEETSYKYYLNWSSDDSINYAMMLPAIKDCCRLIEIDNDIILENQDIGKQRAINELKEK